MSARRNPYGNNTPELANSQYVPGPGSDDVQVLINGRFIRVSLGRAVVLAEYETELARLLALVRFGRGRILQALDLGHCEDCGRRCGFD